MSASTFRLSDFPASRILNDGDDRGYIDGIRSGSGSVRAVQGWNADTRDRWIAIPRAKDRNDDRFLQASQVSDPLIRRSSRETDVVVEARFHVTHMRGVALKRDLSSFFFLRLLPRVPPSGLRSNRSLSHTSTPPSEVVSSSYILV